MGLVEDARWVVGGTAAAVAAGLGPLGVGTDGAGSVRIPAAFCGNFGLKPSFGRIPAYPLSPFGTVSHLGPHTMSVADAALMLNVMQRPDGGTGRHCRRLTPIISPVSTTGSPAGASPIRRRSATPATLIPRLPSPSTVRSACWRKLGAVVEAVDPGFEDPLEITTGLWFTGAWTLWNQAHLGAAGVTDPDFSCRGDAR